MRPTHNVWHLFNLRGSPFFQDILGSGEDARYPLALFVGREAEAHHLLQVIQSEEESRQIVEGPAGFGKTTLLEYVKAQARELGYLSNPDEVRLGSADTTEVLLQRLLSYVYEIVVANGDSTTHEIEAVEQARRVCRLARLHDVTGVQGGFATFAAGATRDVSYVNADAVSPLIVIPPLLKALGAVVRDHVGARGVLVHINDLENATQAEQSRAGLLLRDVRRQLISHGYHFILVGTSEAVRNIVTAHDQLRSVFMTLPKPLGALKPEEFALLLERRYDYLRLDGSEPVRPPVEHEVVSFLYDLFAGDLRGILVALNQAAHTLIGYGVDTDAPMTLTDVHAVLRGIYLNEAVRDLEGPVGGYFQQLAGHDDRPFTQAELTELWNLSQSQVSEHLGTMEGKGYVASTRTGPRALQYTLTARARLALSAGVSGSRLSAPKSSLALPAPDPEP